VSGGDGDRCPDVGRIGGGDHHRGSVSDRYVVADCQLVITGIARVQDGAADRGAQFGDRGRRDAGRI
jgi:hypothetical protein